MPDLGAEARRSRWRLIRTCMSLTAFTLAWLGTSTSYLPPDSQREEPTAASTVDAVVERIIDVESGGDPNAKKRDGTWAISRRNLARHDPCAPTRFG